MELMKQGAVEARQNYDVAQQRKSDQLHTNNKFNQKSNNGASNKVAKAETSNPYELYKPEQDTGPFANQTAQSASMMFGQSESSTNSTNFDASNFELSQSLTQRFGNLEIVDASQINRFQNPATQ